MNKKLVRSRYNRKISGVLGGLGEYFNIDPSLLRFLYVLLTVFSFGFPGVVAYVIAVFVIPEE